MFTKIQKSKHLSLQKYKKVKVRVYILLSLKYKIKIANKSCLPEWYRRGLLCLLIEKNSQRACPWATMESKENKIFEVWQITLQNLIM